MSFVRRLTTRRLLAVIGGALAVVAGGTAIAIAATSGTAVPAQESLPVAVRQALTAPQVQGVTARITFTNKLIDASSLPGGAPLLTGASGRLWATPDGRLRLELQSSSGGGDAQVLVDGNAVSVYESGSKTLYKATLPQDPSEKNRQGGRRHGIPTVATIEKALTRLGRQATVSGATPTSIADRGAYSVKISPKRDGGLLGAAQVAWDAATGTPLRFGVYAAGRADPVLELTATDISYGKVDAGVFDVQAPAGAKIVDLTPKLQQAAAAHKRGTHARGADHAKGSGVTGAAQVAKAVDFDLSTPATLAGLPRKGVRLVTMDGTKGALSVYGRGLGAIVVFQSPAKPAAASGAEGVDQLKGLPQVSIGGATGTELATALGTVVTFERNGVSYTVAGSVPPAAAEAAARGL